MKYVNVFKTRHLSMSALHATLLQLRLWYAIDAYSHIWLHHDSPPVLAASVCVRCVDADMRVIGWFLCQRAQILLRIPIDPSSMLSLRYVVHLAFIVAQ